MPNSDATRDSLPVTDGLTLSDGIGLVAACGIAFALYRTVGLSAASVLDAILSVILFLCLAMLGAGPLVMGPRAVKVGWRTLSSSESIWLTFGLSIDLFLFAVVFRRPARLGWPAIIALPPFLFGMADFLHRAAFRARPRLASSRRWTESFSIALWTSVLLVTIFSLGCVFLEGLL